MTEDEQGNYVIDGEAGEPDSHIVDLNGELVNCDDIFSTSLPKRERQYVLPAPSHQNIDFFLHSSFIFVGLGHLMEQILISNARHLRLPSSFGVKKIMRNVLALQQSLKMLTDDQENTEFERAKQYYSLFFISPQV